MKTRIIICFLLIMPSVLNNLYAQQTGIHFENELSWSQIKQKAKKENKIIFLDAYATWCIPCKEMAQKVFPLPEVGKFFNENFINVAVQFDVTKKDNKYVKSWYKDAKAIQEAFKINSFPTYLFLDPNGSMIHSIGFNLNSSEFIKNAKDALNPKTQYASLKLQYEKGRRDTAFLSTMIHSGQVARDYMNVPTYVNEYLARQKDILTVRNLQLIALATTKSTDIGFPVLIHNTKLLDSIAGRGKSVEIIKTIAFDEEVFPFLKINAKKKIFGPGFYEYAGEINKNVNWPDIKSKLDGKYPEISDELMISSKILYYQWSRDWESYCKAVDEYINWSGDELNINKLNSYARNVLLFCEESKYFPNALQWSKKTIEMEVPKRPWLLNTYSNLLFKMGNQEEAIKTMEEAIKLNGGPNPQYEKELETMKSGNIL